ncbi:DUF4365 domain-containing protein [Methylorubrum populi]|nr:DUF4365 domain-containing protein [Methylorubrum rhodesianum]MBY0140755.1 DUF4365 domain-containing protein [Methylorubrum populi]
MARWPAARPSFSNAAGSAGNAGLPPWRGGRLEEDDLAAADGGPAGGRARHGPHAGGRLGRHETGAPDAGVDGFIEMRDVETGEVRARFVAAQIRTVQRLAEDTGEDFRFRPEERDRDYGLNSDAPVILVVVRLASDRLRRWSVRAHFADPERRRSRQVVFDPAADLLAGDTAGRLADLVATFAKPGRIVPSSRVEETLDRNLLRVVHPEHLFVAPTDLSRGDIREALLRHRAYPARDRIGDDGSPVSFRDLDDPCPRTPARRAPSTASTPASDTGPTGRSPSGASSSAWAGAHPSAWAGGSRSAGSAATCCSRPIGTRASSGASGSAPTRTRPNGRSSRPTARAGTARARPTTGTKPSTRVSSGSATTGPSPSSRPAPSPGRVRGAPVRLRAPEDDEEGQVVRDGLERARAHRDVAERADRAGASSRGATRS